MIIYNYDRATGELIGSCQANPSPAEPGNFLVPACATVIVPPITVANQVAVFSNGSWTVQADFRGHLWDTHANPLLCAIGVMPDGVVTIGTPPPDQVSLWSWVAGAWVVDAARTATAAASTAAANQLVTDIATAAATPAVKSLIAMSPAQIDAWVLANVTDLPSARNAIAILGKIVAVVARNVIK